jgi:hypothetical protein
MLSNTDLHRLIVDLRTHPLAKGGLRQVKEGVYVSLKQSQPKGFDYAFCLSDTDEMYFFFRKADWPSSSTGSVESPTACFRA